MNRVRLIITSLGLLFSLLTNAQQLDRIGKKDAVKINGGISINQVYQHSDSYDISQPYSLVATGNISTSLYGWSIPLSFTWSNYTWTYTQPFNQVSLHPSYKWITAHLGYSSMSFSKWSLSGHSFAGVGLDLSPGKNLTINTMYGRLVKETHGDTVNGVDPAYQRMGAGLNAKYKIKKSSVGLSVFYAADNDDYIYEADSLGIDPAENIIFGATTSLSITRKLKLTAEAYTSLYAEDRRLSRATDWKNDDTKMYLAYKSSISWASKLGQIGVSVERVDPDYESLGAYYTSDDYISYTLNYATSLLKNKVSFSVNTGIQKNNLDDKSDQETEDKVTSVQIGFNPSQSFSMSISYSNFYNYTYIRTVFDESESLTYYDLLDTVSYTQINETINLSANYSFGDKEKSPQAITSSFSYQKAGQEQSDNPDYSNSEFINGSGGYNYSLKALELSFGLSVNYSVSKTEDSESSSLGPMFYVRKKFFQKQLKSTFNVSVNNSSTDGEKTGKTVTSRISSTYSLKKKHNFNLNIAYSHKESSGSTSANYSASLGYSYSFNLPRKKDNVP